MSHDSSRHDCNSGSLLNAVAEALANDESFQGCLSLPGLHDQLNDLREFTHSLAAKLDRTGDRISEDEESVKEHRARITCLEGQQAIADIDRANASARPSFQRKPPEKKHKVTVTVTLSYIIGAPSTLTAQHIGLGRAMDHIRESGAPVVAITAKASEIKKPRKRPAARPIRRSRISSGMSRTARRRFHYFGSAKKRGVKGGR